MDKLTDTPSTDNLEPAIRFKIRFDVFHAMAQKVTGHVMPYQAAMFYIRLYLDSKKEKVYCCVDLDTGDIHMPAFGGRGVNPDARGSIFSEDYGISCLDVTGLKKLPGGRHKGFTFGGVVHPRPNRKKLDKPPKPDPFEEHPTLIRVPEVTVETATNGLKVTTWTHHKKA